MTPIGRPPLDPLPDHCEDRHHVRRVRRAIKKLQEELPAGLEVVVVRGAAEIRSLRVGACP